MSQKSFRSLGVRPQVVDALAARGIITPFPVQELVLPDALAGSDVLVKSPTGSGKTLAFGLALVEPVQERRHQPGAGLIVGDLATHVPRDECGDLLRLVRPAVALGAQESASVHHRDQ